MRCYISLAVAALCSLQSGVATAQTLPPFPELFQQSEKLAPRLLESEANLQAMQGLARQAAALPNPTVSYESENFAGTNQFARISPVQNTLSLSQTVEIGGKRSARIAAGTATAAAAQAGLEQDRIDFGSDLATAYIDCEVAAARVQLLQDDFGRAGEDERAAKLLVQAGRESDLRAIQVRAAVATTQADLESARADLSAALTQISALSGATSSYTDVHPFLLRRADSLSLPEEQLPDQTPALRTAHAEREAAARRVDMERRRPISDITVSVGTRRLAGLDATALVASVSVPVPIFDRNRGAVAAQLAELHAAEARSNALEIELRGRWQAGFAQARAAALRLRAAGESEAAATEAYRLGRIGYDAGRTPLIELLAIRRALTEAQLKALDARSARLQAQITLARLRGRIPFQDTP